MSYTPTNWKSGDVVTSAKLNKLEQGVAEAGGATIVHVDINSSTAALDMTAGAIFEAAQAGPVILAQTDGGEVIATSPVAVGVGRADYYVKGIETAEYTSATADGYPTASSE